MLDRLGEVVAERRKLFEAPLQVLPLRRQLGETRLLLVVLLLRERVHLAQRFAPPLEPLDLLRQLVALVALGGWSACRLQSATRLLSLRLDTRALDLDRAQPLARFRGLAPSLDLGRAEAAQLVGELTGARRADVCARPQRSFELFRDGDVERRDEPLGQACEPLGRAVGRDGVRICWNRRGRARLELFDLGRERTTPRFQLQPHRLGGLAGEPQLAATRIPSVALAGDGRNRGRQQLVFRDDRQAAHELRRIAADEDDETAEPGGARTLVECEGCARIGSDKCRSAPTERGRDGALLAGEDVDK